MQSLIHEENSHRSLLTALLNVTVYASSEQEHLIFCEVESFIYMYYVQVDNPIQIGHITFHTQYKIWLNLNT